MVSGAGRIPAGPVSVAPMGFNYKTLGIDMSEVDEKVADQAPDPEAQAGEVAQQASPDADESIDEVAELKKQLAERTEDLQRLQAEYVNYKKRVDRDRPLARQSGIDAVLRDLMPAFDSIVAAQNMGHLSDGFKLTADEFIKVARQYGMVKVGEVGEEFNPLIHEALMQQPVAGTGEPTIHEVMQVGYQINGQTVRPARVVVAMPTGEAEEDKAEESQAEEPKAEADKQEGTEGN